MSYKALVAEFIGTFTLIFVGVGSIAADYMTGGKLGITGIALAHGLAIGVMVTIALSISGGQLNPAMTLGAFVGGKIGAKDAVQYVIAQCLGAIVGAVLIQQTVPSDVLGAVQMGTPMLGRDSTWMQGFIAEVVLTFFLVLTVFGTAIDQKAPRMGGLFIGFAVVFGVLAGGPISGAAMNPARHLGPALLGGFLSDSLLYWIGPLVGGAIAGVVARYLFSSK
ncbi:MAG: aquaporin [Ignavibacteria bacterium RIFCSPLOWO2_02_FULL_55_14]|nr:MAG: aquaporin [Ignavibacteria bacterium GWC2_56_12]OGU66731.1 MAG: aquaporin [Ignavibacteria bacterium RIFCSPHIGHO2_02_FULL_56_12]OGU70888.1 MAG: aquaporin [Ignavibacteria bacterium RIFCSPLOWO2_12_FULL_56_21]OGU73339.1 MAG: aquaporin [Ignavibacteria bacterium RIFCSPLOWO2_02_FULL_55_14]HAV22095.1 aquaporin [Bacteroidota bacterium]